MSSTEFSVEEEVDKALAALIQACKRIKQDRKECQEPKKGSEDKGDSEQQV
jgi:hypothetical protein